MSGNAQDALDSKMVLSPLLSVRNGIRAVEFYKQALGAKELSRIDDGQGSIVARLSIGTSEFGWRMKRRAMPTSAPSRSVAAR